MHAVQLANSIIGTAGLKEGELRAAAVTDDQGHSTVSSSNNAVAVAAMATNKQPKAFKKAFLDAKPRDNNKNSSSRKVRWRRSAYLADMVATGHAERALTAACCSLVLLKPWSLQPTNNSSSKAGQQIPLLKAQPQQQLGSKPIPDFLRVPPDEQEQRLGVMKTQLLSALQPTPDTISAVAEDATLMSGV